MACGNESVRTLRYFPTEWLMSMVINVIDHKDESAENDNDDGSMEWIIMYNDTMDMIWKDAMKAYCS